MRDTVSNEGWVRLGVVFGMGLLIGLQRQRVKAELGGVRTFPIAALCGALASLLSDQLGPWPFVVSGVGLITFASVAERKGEGAGITSEVALVMVFLLGAWIPQGPLAPAIVIAGVLLVLLQAKTELHDWTQRLRDEDLRSLAQFVLVSCVILPVLPDQGFGPFGALNPREIWWMVVLIVGVSLLGYIAQKLFKQGAGTATTGIIGGLVSSTATTATFSRQSKGSQDGVAAATLVIVLASTVVYMRLGIALSIAAPAFGAIRLPLAIMGGVGVMSSVAAYVLARKDQTKHGAPEAKPGDLRTALVFAALYGAITLATTAAKHYLGSAGLYVVSAVSGLTDVDAVSLSTARLVANGRIDSDDGARFVVVAIMSNLVFKLGIVGVLGSRRLLVRSAALLALHIATAAAVMWIP